MHLAAYDAAPAGDKFGLVLEAVDHYFGGLICKYDVPGPTRHAQLTAAVSLSTMFMEAYGMRENMAQRLLEQARAQKGPARLSRK